MIHSNLSGPGLEIKAIATCDFKAMDSVSNADLLTRLGKKGSSRIENFIESEMGIKHRYFCKKDQNSLDLARSALSKLVKETPSLIDDAEFFILAGISNPMPVTTTSALLSGEFGFKNASCWDVKSGCSSGVLALIQAMQWINMGASNGVIVCTETLSKYSNPEILQMSASIGDGAAAFHVTASEKWRVKGMVHGTDSSLVKGMMVEGTFPIDIAHYNPLDYYYTFDQKPQGIEAIGKYWVQSLQNLLQASDISPSDVKHYIPHQIDAAKNANIAKACGISSDAVAKNIEQYGNMGCPTAFINYHEWFKKGQHVPASGDALILHAVGGGVSWAGVCLQYE